MTKRTESPETGPKECLEADFYKFLEIFLKKIQKMCFSLDICWTTYCIITLTLYKGLKYTIKNRKKEETVVY